MPLYELITHTSFENVYIVEADSLDAAMHQVLHEDCAPDFHQKHLGESIIRSSELCSGDPDEADFDIANTSIRERGYR